MSRNRIIHNVQEVLVGSPDGEDDAIVTGIIGHQILKRLNLVQSFNYTVGTKTNTADVLGKSAPIAEKVDRPPDITLDLSYYLDGVNNEKRLGLTCANGATTTDLWNKNIIHEITDNSRDKDKRNIYLIVNKNAQDINNPTKDYPRVDYMNDSTLETQKGDLINPESTGYGVVIFQNCYLDSYSLNVEPGSMPLVNISYVADNIVAYASGSGINIPYLDSKKGEVTDTVASVYTSDFYSDTVRLQSAGSAIEGWTPSDGEISWGITSYNGETYPLKVIFSTTNGGQDNTSGHYTYKDFLTVGKKYRITGKVYINSSNSKVNVVGIDNYIPGNQATIKDITTKGEWVSFDEEFTAVGSVLYFWAKEGTGDYTFQITSGSDEFAIKDIVVTEIKEFIIPRHFKNISNTDTLDFKSLEIDSGTEREALKSNNIEFTLSPESENGIAFYKDTVQSCSIDFSLERENINLFAHNLYSDRLPEFPVEVSMSVDLLSKETLTGSFLTNVDENTYYNATIDFKNESGEIAARYSLSKAKLKSTSQDSSVRENKTASLNLKSYMNFEDNDRGLFVSGKVLGLVVNILNEDQSTPPEGPEYVLNDDGEILKATVGNPQF